MATTIAVTSKKRWLQLLPFFAFFIILFAFTCRLPFFWDKDILFSKIAFWLLDHNFALVLPNDLDTGYPSALGYLLALTWKLTGKSLFSAHLLMLPFTLGMVWQTRNLLDHFLGGRSIVPAMVLLFADTTFLSQTVVFSTDLVMLFFILLALNSIILGKRNLLAVALMGLLFSHFRGLLIAATLGLFDIYQSNGLKKLRLWRITLPYLPALILFGTWMLFHYYHTGWILFHPTSPWAGCYERVYGAGVARNIVILLWRMVDYGRLFVWIIPVLAFFMYDRKKLLADRSIQLLLLLLTATLLFTIPIMLFYKILNGHRYLIPFYYFLSLLSAYLLFINPGFPGTRKILTTVVIAGLISGSFWVYPGKIANGWDATLAHLPYHHLRKEMIGYIEDHKIPFDKIGTGIPNTAALKYIAVNDDERIFPLADLQRQPYIFYSNIFNMFTDAEIDELKNHWVVEKEYRCLQVYVILYRKEGQVCNFTTTQSSYHRSRKLK